MWVSLVWTATWDHVYTQGLHRVGPTRQWLQHSGEKTLESTIEQAFVVWVQDEQPQECVREENLAPSLAGCDIG